MTEVIAQTSFVRQSPRKLQLVADQVRGLKVDEALVVLNSLPKKAAGLILATLKQAIGNAVNNFNLAKEDLVIKHLMIQKGPHYKRTDKAHRAFRWGTIRKRNAHIKIVLEGKEAKVKAKKVVKKGSQKNGSKN